MNKSILEKCQVFTPTKIVEDLLDAVEYKKNLFGKKVIENACGDGRILIEIVRRYITDSLDQDKSLEEIKQGLQADIYGVEIDTSHYKSCLHNLSLVAESFKISDVVWNVFNGDILKQHSKDDFDFVIGNPPYIKYHDLDNKTRDYLRKNYDFCKRGKFDYCYAFIESSIHSLNPNGKMAYLIPNSIFKNIFAQDLRNMILPYTTKIIDYTIQNLFDTARTSSAILVCQLNSSNSTITYKNVYTDQQFPISKSSLSQKWIFSNTNTKERSVNKQKFGYYFTAANSVATLLNEAYVLKEFIREKDYIIVGDSKIELCLAREGVSPRSLCYNKQELILFPYKYEQDSLKKYSREYFESNFPQATKYLKLYSAKLEKRKSDCNTEWFEYGRSQALAHLNQPKLLLSRVITNQVKIYELNENCIPYSGIYIIPKRELDLKKAKDILRSKEFYEYINEIGINVNGGSLRITAKDINNFRF